MENFRPIGTIDQFLDVLSSSKKTKLLVWQSLGKDRLKTEGFYDKHSKEKKKTTVILNLQKNISFNQDDFVFIYEEEKGLLFKGMYEFCVNKKLHITIDEKVFLKERRSDDRLNFYYSAINLKTNLGPGVLKDINDKGFSLLVTEAKAKNFKKDSDVQLEKIHTIELPKAINAKVVHMTKATLPKQKGKTIVGCKFNRRSKLMAKVIEGLANL